MVDINNSNGPRMLAVNRSESNADANSPGSHVSRTCPRTTRQDTRCHQLVPKRAPQHLSEKRLTNTIILMEMTFRQPADVGMVLPSQSPGIYDLTADGPRPRNALWRGIDRSFFTHPVRFVANDEKSFIHFVPLVGDRIRLVLGMSRFR